MIESVAMSQSKKVRFLAVVLLGAALTAVELLQVDWLPGRERRTIASREKSESTEPQTYLHLPPETKTTEPQTYLHLPPETETTEPQTYPHLPPETERQRSNRDQVSEGDSKVAREGGYVLAVDYWEQQTSGSRNLQSLQCWAAQLNLSVVEPTISRSQLKTPLINHLDKSRLWFRDYYDVDQWNRLSSALKHSQLVGWDNYLAFAPRDVILVSVRHAFSKDVKKNLEQLSRSGQPHKSPSQRIREGCPDNWTAVRGFLGTHHFKVVREVCFNFAYGDSLSEEEFEAHLYGSLPPSSSTVVFSQWRGTGPSSRVFIRDSKCENTRVQEKVGPSQHLLLHVRHYQQRFLGGGQYFAIIARMEKVQALLRSRQGKVTLAQCFSKLLGVWRETGRDSGLNSTLLAIDMGRFGSNSIHHAGQGSELDSRFRDFFKSLYGSRLTVEEWEESFEDVAHTADPGYVAALQQMLVVQAKCVIFIGGGSFQKHAHTLYMSSHQRDKCVRVVDVCTYPFKKSY